MTDKPKNPAAVELGKLGGQVKSAAKTEAVRRNGKLGGWPKGRKRGPRKAKDGKETTGTYVWQVKE